MKEGSNLIFWRSSNTSSKSWLSSSLSRNSTNFASRASQFYSAMLHSVVNVRTKYQEIWELTNVEPRYYMSRPRWLIGEVSFYSFHLLASIRKSLRGFPPHHWYTRDNPEFQCAIENSYRRLWLYHSQTVLEPPTPVKAEQLEPVPERQGKHPLTNYCCHDSI